MLDASPAAAGRPLETEDTDTLSPGRLELEASGDYAREPGETVWTVKGVLNVGVVPRVEGKLELPVLVSDPDGSPSRAGVGDVVAGVKYRILDEIAAVPAMGGAIAVRLPTGRPDRGLGEHDVDVTVLGIVGKRFASFVLHGNVGYTFVTADRRRDVWIMAASLEYQLSERVALVGEALGFLPTRRDEETTARWRAGFTYAVRDNVKVDAAVGHGLTRESPRTLMTVGVTIGF